MARDYSFESLVAIPKATAAGLLAMGQALITAAQAEPELPAALDEPLEWLVERQAELQGAAGAQATPAGAKESARPWDLEADGLHAAQRQWLSGLLVDVPENALRPVAQKLHDLWYGAGPFYAGARFHDQWAATEVRLKRIDQEGLRGSYEQLGATFHLDALQRVHAAYGRALGVTAPAATPEPAGVSDPMLALADAIRDWIGKVAATRSRKDPASAARIDRLLASVA